MNGRLLLRSCVLLGLSAMTISFAVAKDDPLSTWSKRASLPELASEATGALVCSETGGNCDSSSLGGLGGNVVQEGVKSQVGSALKNAATRAAQRETVMAAQERAAREAAKRTFDQAVAAGTSKQAAAKAAERAGREAATRAGREAAEELARRQAAEAAKEAGEKAVRQGLEPAAREAAERAAREAGEKAVKETVEGVVERGPSQIAGRAAGEATGEIVESRVTRGGTRLGRGILDEYVEAGKGKGTVGRSGLDHLGTAAGMAGAFSGDDPVGVAQEGLHGLVGGTFVWAGTSIGAAEGGKWGTMVGCWLAPGPGCLAGGAIGTVGGGLIGGAVGAVAGANAKKAAEPGWDELERRRRDEVELNRRAQRARGLFREAALECNAANRALDLAKARIDNAANVATQINGRRGDASASASAADSAVTACADAQSVGEELVNLLNALNERIDEVRSSQFATTSLTNAVCNQGAMARSGGIPEDGLAQAATGAKADLANAESSRRQAESSLAEARAVSSRLEAAHGRAKKLVEDARRAAERLETAETALTELARQAMEAGNALGDADAKLGQARADFQSCRTSEDRARNALAGYMDDDEAVELVRFGSSTINMRYDRITELESLLNEAHRYLDTEQSALPTVQNQIQSAVAGLASCTSVNLRTGEVDSALNLVRTFEANLPRDLNSAVADAQSCVDTLVAMSNPASVPTTTDRTGGGSGTSETASGAGTTGCDPTDPTGGCYNPLADPNTVTSVGSSGGGRGGEVDPSSVPALSEPTVPGSGGTQNVPQAGQPIDPGYTRDPVQDVRDTERVIEAENEGGPFTPQAPPQPGADIADDFGTPPDISKIPDREPTAESGGTGSGGTGSGTGGAGGTGGTAAGGDTGGGTGGSGGTGGTESGGTGDESGGTGGGAQPSESEPVAQEASCDDTNEAGSNQPERYTINVGSDEGAITFSWTMYTIKDQMTVSGAGVDFSTRCVSGSNSVSFNKTGSGSQVTVEINPNCDPSQKGRNTQWNFSISCPSN